MNLRVAPADPAAIVPLLDQVNVWSVAAGLESMADVVAGCYAFQLLTEEGELVGAYALRGQDKPGGVIVWLTAGQGRADGFDLTRDFLPHIERQAEGADYLAIQTTRPGLVKKLADQGWQMGGTVMVKKL